MECLHEKATQNKKRNAKNHLKLAKSFKDNNFHITFKAGCGRSHEKIRDIAS